MSQRPLFDPKKMAVAREKPAEATALVAAPIAAPPPPATGVLTVSALASVIDTALRTGVPGKVRVVGEISGFRDRTHWYFDLKDANAVVNAVMFQGGARRAGFAPQNGQEVVATGRVEFYAKHGKVSLLVEKLEPVGAGALELAYRKLCEELRAMSWFDPARKRSLPTFPRKIAVVTSRSAAALQDVLVTMRQRCSAVSVLLVDVRVQGEGAAGEVADAVRYLSQHHARLGVDAVLVTRGGGSMEDLWAFNDRGVAEAIVNCAIPVVAAIGHETDTTIAELVADERCATPTQAAMRLTPDSEALLRQTDAFAQRLRFVVGRQLRADQERVERAAARPAMRDPAALVRRADQELTSMWTRLGSVLQLRLGNEAVRMERRGARLERNQPRAVQARSLARLHAAETRMNAALRARLELIDLDSDDSRLQRALKVFADSARARMNALERQLKAVGPMSVLERGFSVTTREDGRLLRSTRDARSGDRLKTTLADGSVESVVDGPDAATPTISKASKLKPEPVARETTRTPAARRASNDQQSLFDAP